MAKVSSSGIRWIPYCSPPSRRQPRPGGGWIRGRSRVNSVHFTPCARTAWHTHAVGQTLHVTEGIGLVATGDGQVNVMQPGDTVHTPPGEWHWHGAVNDRFMTRLAIWDGTDTPETTWGEHVTDDDYQRAMSQYTRQSSSS